MESVSPETESRMKVFYKTLNEKDRRRYAAHEASRLGRGGVTYIAKLLGSERNTIMAGQKDLKYLEETGKDRADGRCRIVGGGRKEKIKTVKGIEEVFLEILKNNTAGDPMNEDIIWTNLTQKEIQEGMDTEGISVSITVIKKLLKKHKYVKRKAQKTQSLKEDVDRDAQFKNIEKLRAEYENMGNPIISVDTKKKNF